MKSLSDFITENSASDTLARLKSKKSVTTKKTTISKVDLIKLEKHLDMLFKDLNIDIEFSSHFFDRLHDARNGKEITIDELNDIFTKAHTKYGVKISHSPDAFEAVLKSVATKINIPFVVNLKRNGMIEVTGKTVMRKKNFSTSNLELKV
ncbi:MAG: hypothetical protein R8M45_04370 [Ghiorsea sp.]